MSFCFSSVYFNSQRFCYLVEPQGQHTLTEQEAATSRESNATGAVLGGGNSVAEAHADDSDDSL